MLASPGFGRQYLEYALAIELSDWTRLKACLAKLSQEPSKATESLLLEFSESAQRIGETGLSITFLSHLLSRQSFPLPLWDGLPTAEPVHIDLAETSRQGVAHAMLAAKHVFRALSSAKTAQIYCEPRLAPILSRSFPSARVWAKEPGTQLAAVSGFFANLNVLRTRFDTTYDDMASNPGVLTSDPELVQSLQTKYRCGATPVIGISWSSPHSAKQLPGTPHWASLLSRIDATFVSLQFMPDEQDLANLEALSGRRLIVDASIDQRVDLDRFAAQVRAMDAVVSISNTTAHLAGSLGVPVVVVRDDAFQWVWDVNRRTTAWYSSARLVRRTGRSWGETFRSVEEELGAALKVHASCPT
jgi:hypothetical protein